MAAVSCSIAVAQQPAQQNMPPAQSAPWPGLGSGTSPDEVKASIELAPELHRGISAQQMLRDRRRLDKALAALVPQRKGVVDAYVVTIALDSEPVFAREAKEAGKVLSRRYNAAGRTMVLAGPDGKNDEAPRGSISALLVTLARISELMDPDEDVLVLYSTSHGMPQGLAYRYGDMGYGILSPARLKGVLEELKLQRRVLMLSACYSGVFIPVLASSDTAILTASAANRTSFGCEPDNDWTFFGDALINHALRKPQGLEQAAEEANRLVVDWESRKLLLASLPQISVGEGAKLWLRALDARVPKIATNPVGKPSLGE